MSTSPHCAEPEQASFVMEKAELLYDRKSVDDALERIASQLNTRLTRDIPIVLCVMNGGLVIAGQLLPRLNMQLQLDYVHATRYRNQTTGSELEWKRHHELSLKGRIVVILDDILDEGETLKGILQACLDEGAKEVISVVLVEKKHSRNNGVVADYVGLEVPDRYVFGCGMDYCGFWRNANGIYAVTEE